MFHSRSRCEGGGIYPYFHALESRQDVEVIMEGKRRIMLGSNNYLGLTVNEDIINAGIETLRQYGTGCSGSRFLNGTLRMHLELEEELADFLNKESVVTFSTGFQTNLGIISALVGHGDYVICDKENHASIYDGCKLSYGRRLLYRHSDMDELERILKGLPEDSGKLIVTDGVFSMGGDIAKLPEIVALAKKYGARTMVDDAHALGVIGPGRQRHGGLLRTGGRGGYLHGNLLQVARVARRLYGGECTGGRIRAAHLASVHLLGVDPAGKLRNGTCGAAAPAHTSGNR